MAFVHTAHGLGRIVATDTVRGRTRHKVAGPGFEIWLDAADVREASLGDINEDNSTTLPYDPTPQYPSDMWSHDTTIQPGMQEIDAEERLSPSDSVTFDSGREVFPGPNPELFAKHSSYGEYDDAPFDGESGTSDDYHDEMPSQFNQDILRRNHELNKKKHSGLGSKYATWKLATPEADDSVSRFRRDPIQEINRLGYLWTGGVEQPEMADYGRLVEADKMLREAAWADVRQKAQRLRREGRVHVLQLGPGTIYANVEGDHGTYTTMIAKTGNTQSIDKWACSCEWGKWAFQRKISYVGRLCSHGYASYLEMQADQHKGNPGRFHHPRKSASVVDDFQDYVNDFRNGHVDIDAADNFITLPQHSQKEDPYTEDEVQDIYDWTRDNLTHREPRNYKMPYYAAKEDGERAKVLRTHPMSLTPDLVKVPKGEDPYFVDVTEDERETTGPGQIMHGSLVDAMGNPYTPTGFWRTADETTTEDPTKKPAASQTVDPNVAVPRTPSSAPSPSRREEERGPAGGGVDMSAFNSLATPVINGISEFAQPIAQGIGSAIGNAFHASLHYADTDENGYEVPEGDLEHLRELSDDEPDFGHTDSQNGELRDVVEALRDEGYDASPIVASKGCCAKCCETGDCENCDCHCGSTKEGSYGLGNQGQGQPGGAFGQPGGGSWADRAFSGSGPDPKYWFGTSEDLIDRGDEDIEEHDVTEGTGETNHWNESDRPGQGKKKSSRYLFANDDDMTDELVQSVGEEIEGIGQYNQFLDEAHELGDEEAADTIEEALHDEHDHVENLTDALEHTAAELHGEPDYEDWDTGRREEPKHHGEPDMTREGGMNDIVRRFQASGGGALANDGGGNYGDDAIAGQARKFLAKTAGRVYSLAEQQELIDESHPGGARNKPTHDDLRGTHYV